MDCNCSDEGLLLLWAERRCRRFHSFSAETLHFGYELVVMKVQLFDLVTVCMCASALMLSCVNRDRK